MEKALFLCGVIAFCEVAIGIENRLECELLPVVWKMWSEEMRYKVDLG
jgi:hypothetical protein